MSAPAALVPHPAGLPCWAEEDGSADLVCRAVQHVTHDVRTVVFEPAQPSVFHFDPGQFITLELEVGGRRVERSYSISSPPTRPHLLAITVKRVPGGLVSNWLHDTVRPGTRVRAQAPLGAFSIARAPALKYLFLSAGSGITPLMSMVRTLVDLAADADVVFVHSAHTPADIVFRSELSGLPTSAPNVRVAVVCSDDSFEETWTGHRGRLDADVLAEVAPDLQERIVFSCGPAGYRAAVRDLLAARGLDPANLHEESYSFADLTPADLIEPVIGDPVGLAPGIARGADETGHEVRFARSGRTFRCAPDDTILTAAFRAGLTPPSSCTQGLCGTCKTVLLEGEVDMQHNGGIRPREIAAGKVLICCSRPRGDVVLDA